MKTARYLIPALLLAFAACSVESVAPPNAPDEPDDDLILDGKERVVTGLQAFYSFNEGSGLYANDTSASGNRAILEIEDPNAVSWIPGGGINIKSPTRISSSLPPTQVGTACITSDAVTVEAWVKTASIIQDGPAYFLSYGENRNGANFTLAQTAGKVLARVKTSTNPEGNDPELLSLRDAFVNAAELTHIVYTRSGSEDLGYFYVNGESSGQIELAGNFTNWSAEAPLVIGNSGDGTRPWRGEVHAVAVYCTSLSPQQIFQNFSAGI